MIPNALGNNDGKDRPEKGLTGSSGLVGYIAPRVKRGRDVRNERFRSRWREYTRLWRGFWTSEDKNANSERSRLIAPALQQSIEMTAAEMEEAVFGKIAWFDVEDDIADENKEDAIAYRDQLLEDFHLTGVADAVSKVFLLGAIYGTGIAKINVGRRPIWAIDEGQTKVEKRVMVDVEAIRPDEFVIDPSALTVEDAEFVAHEIVKPSHVIAAKIKAKQYRDAPLRPYSGIKGDPYGTGRWDKADSLDNGVLITEYYCKVPSKFLKGGSGDTLVEALVTLVNESYVLKAVKSPFTNKDRPVIAYQHDTVPGEFWGRGVAEKGYNPQKALDSELRARIDAYALMNAPMLGADITRLPRNPDMRVRPGKIFMTRGRPSEIIEPVAYNANLAATFQQSGDLERMVQMGTGASPERDGWWDVDDASRLR